MRQFARQKDWQPLEVTTKRLQKAPTLLLVEDDDADIFLVKRSLAKRQSNINLVVARDGEEALSLLREGEDVVRPYVILTDLNMPGMSGYEFVDEIRADSNLKDSVVFVISSSTLPEDVKRAYMNFASGYIKKDMQPEQMIRSLQLVFDFCEIVSLPE